MFLQIWNFDVGMKSRMDFTLNFWHFLKFLLSFLKTHSDTFKCWVKVLSLKCFKYISFFKSHEFLQINIYVYINIYWCETLLTKLCNF